MSESFPNFIAMSGLKSRRKHRGPAEPLRSAPGPRVRVWFLKGPSATHPPPVRPGTSPSGADG